jgi:hypothetical protein
MCNRGSFKRDGLHDKMELPFVRRYFRSPSDVQPFGEKKSSSYLYFTKKKKKLIKNIKKKKNRRPNAILTVPVCCAQGLMQDVRLIRGADGQRVQCPSLDTSCPTCGQFIAMQKTMENLNKIVHLLSNKVRNMVSRTRIRTTRSPNL